MGTEYSYQRFVTQLNDYQKRGYQIASQLGALGGIDSTALKITETYNNGLRAKSPYGNVERLDYMDGNVFYAVMPNDDFPEELLDDRPFLLGKAIINVEKNTAEVRAGEYLAELQGVEVTHD